MIWSRRVALNGVQLDEVHDAIVIRSVEPGDGKESLSAVSSAAKYGQRVTGNRRDTLDMVVKFAINIRKDNLAGRAEVLELVNAWAARARGGAWLTLNYKTNRRLRVMLVQAPGEGSLWDYTKEFTITFRAYGVPYWEDETATSQRIGGDILAGTGSFALGGSMDAPIDAELLNRSGQTVVNASITIGGVTMSFPALRLGANETLVIDHTDDGLLRIRIRDAGGTYRSAMGLRADSSGDDFILSPGNISASYSAQRACRLTVSWRCRYL